MDVVFVSSLTVGVVNLTVTEIGRVTSISRREILPIAPVGTIADHRDSKPFDRPVDKPDDVF